MSGRRIERGWCSGWTAGVVAMLALLIAAPEVEAQAQLSYRSGQRVSPAYEGWQEAPDGTRYFVFGYMNRNWEEEVVVPIGPNNHFSVGGEDQGQPTRFLPRRNRFTFKVPVPAGFREEDEMIWTVTANGETVQAFATLRQDYFIDNVVIMSETGSLGAGTSSPEIRSNQPPTIDLEGDTFRQARVGVPMTIVARVRDDGLPRTRGGEGSGAELVAAAAEGESRLSAEERAFRRALVPPRRVTVGKTNGLHLAWFLYRGAGNATFDPPQVKSWEDTRTGGNSPWAPLWEPPAIPEDGRYVVQVTFDQPGTYVLRGRADDGGLFADQEITVQVTN
jgi:hypothetical protein